jgi:predicted permease
VRLLTSETLVLAAIAGAAALLAAAWGGSLLRSVLLPEIDWADSIIDWRVIGFTAVVTLIAGLVAGLVPAIQSVLPDLTRALKSGGRHGDRHRSRLRGSLVVTQAALSVILLVGATLFVRSLQNVQSLDIGFDAGQLLFGSVEFPDGESPPRAVVAAAVRDIAQRLESRPGVDAVARGTLAPMRGFSFTTFYSGADSTGSFAHNMPTMMGVSPSFFRAAGIRMLEGSGFSGGDAEGALPEVVVNEAMAELLGPGRAALGQCMRFGSRDSSCYIVSGVVENTRRDRVIEESPAPQYYLPLGNFPLSGWTGTVLIVRAGPSARTAAAAELRNALRQAFPTAEPTVTPMTENLEPEYRPWRLGATLFTAFGVLALVVTLIGVFSTVSYDVSQRTHEFGVRVALGARLRDVLTQVVGEGTRTIAIGIVLGIALAIAAGRLIGALLYGIEPHDPFVLAGVSSALLIVAAVATLVPAWRAARADPVIALRAD